MIREANLPQTATNRISRQLERAAASAEILTDEERRELHEHEQTITHGVRAWLAMGVALMAIQDKRLYRETHTNLDDYCRERFGLADATAYALTQAAKRYQIVAPIASKYGIQLTTESQMRPLCRCQAVDLPKVLALTAKKVEPDDKGQRFPTAKILKEAVQQVTHRGPLAPAGEGNGHATTEAKKGDPAVETIRAMSAWSDSVLMTVARAMARELQTRGLIKNFNVA